MTILKPQNFPSLDVVRSIATIAREHLSKKLGNMPSNFTWTEAEENGLYSMAYGYYEQRRYADALQLFFILAWGKKSESRYFKGIAACYQMMGRYAEAITFFNYVYVLNLRDPTPLYHMAQCVQGMGDIYRTKQTFSAFIEHSAAISSCKDMRAHAQQVLTMLSDAQPDQQNQEESK